MYSLIDNVQVFTPDAHETTPTQFCHFGGSQAVESHQIITSYNDPTSRNLENPKKRRLCRDLGKIGIFFTIRKFQRLKSET